MTPRDLLDEAPYEPTATHQPATGQETELSLTTPRTTPPFGSDARLMFTAPPLSSSIMPSSPVATLRLPTTTQEPTAPHETGGG